MDVEKEAPLEWDMEKKPMKKKQRKSEASRGVTDCTGAVPNFVEDGFQLNKKETSKKKDKREAEISFGTYKAQIHLMDHAKVENNWLKEVKKKKKRNSEAVCNDQSNDDIHNGEEEKMCLQMDGEKVFENVVEQKVRKEKKKRLKNDIRKCEDDSIGTPMEILKAKDTEGYVVKKRKSSQMESSAEMEAREEQNGKKKNKKKFGRNEEVGNFEGENKSTAEEVVEKSMNDNMNVSEKVKKKTKRDNNKNKDLADSKVTAHSTTKKSEDSETKCSQKSNRKEAGAVENGSEDPKSKRKPKKVSFSGHVEVFPLSDGPSKGEKKDHVEGLVRGKRFSPEEDEMIKEAVFNYIQAHDLGEEGLNMVLHCRSHSKLKNCWQDIGAALPHRPYSAIYYRAHSILERDGKRSWTPEELELVKRFYDQHGPQWRKLADATGKNRIHLKDAWRRIKVPNQKKGHWSQEEYQTLFDLVNIDLRAKALEEKKSKHGMLRDNISWSAISDRLSTRNNALCCVKWYEQLTSPMVKEGNWADVDDYHLLGALFSLDACCIEDVDWDNLLEHRSGDVCRKRWKQMVNHIGKHGTKSFSEQVEILLNRYCPDMLEAREAWDSKPVVP